MSARVRPNLEPEWFGQLLQEKLDELDAAAAEEAFLAVDDVEQLRLRAAVLATRGEARPWVVGAGVRYPLGVTMPAPPDPPRLDIRYPALPPERREGPANAKVRLERQGRRIP